MKITLTDDDGIVLEIIEAEDIGDLESRCGRADLIDEIVRWWKFDREQQEGSKK